MAEELMNWRSDNHWHLKHNGERFKKSPRQLRKLYPDLVTADTQAGTRKAANQFVIDKLATLNQPTYAETRLDEMIDWAVKTGNVESAKSLQLSKEEGLDPFKIISNEGKAVWIDRLQQAKKKGDQSDNALKLAKDWLESKKLKVEGKTRSPGHWANLQREITAFVNWFGADKSVTEINGLTFSQWHDHLVKQMNAGEMGASAAKKYQGTAKTWINWLWENDQIASLPKNLKNKDLIFEITYSEPVPWAKEDLHFVLPYCKGKPMELWLLLMANLGMTNSEVAAIKHEDVDWTSGMITLGRNKTKRFKRVPVITIPLWKTTFDLLKKHRSEHPEFVLVNEEGNPLWFEGLETNDETDEDEYTKYDNIQSNYYDLKLLIKASNPEWKHKPLKQLRKTGPSMFRDNPEFTSIRQLFLRHAHEEVADLNYAAIPSVTLIKAVKWLGQALGIK